MLYLITGGSASGKSEYAEKLATECFHAGDFEQLHYIATMYPYDGECRKRIARHRHMRREKGFHTIERYTQLSGLKAVAEDVFLLECMSNLLANEMYLPQGGICKRDETAIASADKVILDPLLHLKEMAGALYVVTNEVFSEGTVYDNETDTYLKLLGHINRQLAQNADKVVEVVCGIPVFIK